MRAAWAHSMNECCSAGKTILPNTVRHATIKIDLMAILRYYQSRYGAMYSGCGGGYLYVVSEEPVPGLIDASRCASPYGEEQPRTRVVVEASLDDLVSRHVDLLEEVAEVGTYT